MTKEQRLVLTIAVLASLVVFLDQTIVNVALPAIEEELGGGLAAQQWIINAYLLTLGSFILIAGSLSDVLGRVTILRVGLLGFGAMSILIAAAPTVEVLIAARAVQGAAGALVVPSSLALITSTFRGPSQARAIGIWTAATSIGAACRPLDRRDSHRHLVLAMGVPDQHHPGRHHGLAVAASRSQESAEEGRPHRLPRRGPLLPGPRRDRCSP